MSIEERRPNLSSLDNTSGSNRHNHSQSSQGAQSGKEFVSSLNRKDQEQKKAWQAMRYIHSSDEGNNTTNVGDER
jgi:hypothetical protein